MSGYRKGAEPTAIELRMMAQSLGRKGGLKGGKARARKYTARELSAAARHAALARWSKADLKKALSEMTLEELIADQERDMKFGHRTFSPSLDPGLDASQL